MAVRIDMDMPSVCYECPFFVETDVLTNGKCQALPIRDLNGDIVEHQVVSSCVSEKSIHCPLKECE